MTPSLLVLVVDDDERNRKLARDVLGAAGFRTIEATNGRDSIAIAAERLPDVILLDLRLPDMDGTEVARRLRDEPRTAQIPLVALSALRHAGDGESLVASDFAGFLEKPIDVVAFPAQVRSYCGWCASTPSTRQGAR
jgi:CheY-like chemotaxis protein